MSKFHVGDVVRVKKGLTFRKTGIANIEKEFCGKFFKIDNAWSETNFELQGTRNYVFHADWLEPVKSKVPDASKFKIVIVNDGKTTNAVLYKSGTAVGRAEAICHEDDEFDVMTGAKIALDRLMGKEPEKPSEYHPGQLVQVLKDKMGHGFEIGSCAMLLCKEDNGNWRALGFCTDIAARGIETMYISEDEFVAID